MRKIEPPKPSEEALRESEARYRLLFNSGNDAVFVHRPTPEGMPGPFIEVNDVACRRYGYTREELFRLTPVDLSPPQSTAEFGEQVKQVFEHKHILFETVQVTKEGRPIPVEINAHLFDYNHQPSVFSIARDTTEHKKLEQQLIHAQKMEAVGRLAGGLAHDFKNLMTVIIGYSTFVLTDLDQDNPLCRDVETIRQAGESAVALTDQLLSFSRKQLLKPKILHLNQFVTHMEKMLKRLIGEDVELETVSEPNCGKVEVDPGHLEQVIMNLVVNARDAMPDGGKITISTANAHPDEVAGMEQIKIDPGPYVRLAVRDTGVGMDAETRSHLFEPFFTTKAPDMGTGLGLSTVYGIVKQSGGYIWVESAPQKGTTFKIYLPRAEGIAVAIPKQYRPRYAGKGSETVLVVEDHHMVRKFVRSALEEKGYHVLEAEHGDAALKRNAQHPGPIPLLVTDVVMPGMTGWELANRLQLIRPKMKVLFMSGYSDRADVPDGWLGPGAAFIHKPIDPERLVQKVREVLDR